MVCGLGQVGYRVANLLMDLGESVTVVAMDWRESFHREIESRGATIIKADARELDVLVGAGIDTCRAVLAVTATDDVNIQIGLLCKQRRPGIRVVARVFDQKLGRQLERSIGVDKAVAMSLIAAPNFAAAGESDEVLGEFIFDENPFSVARILVTEDSPYLGKLPSEVAESLRASVMARVKSDGSLDLGSSDEPLETGHILKILGESLGKHFETESQHKTFHRTESHLKVSMPQAWHGFVEAWIHAPKVLQNLFYILNGLILLSVVVFKFGMHLSLVDAVYFVVSTFTTTGYGDITPLDSHPALKLYCALIMILGSASVAVLYSILTDWIISLRLQQRSGGLRVPDGGHFVVAGGGEVGFMIAQTLLESGREVVMIDLEPSTLLIKQLSSRCALVFGDARQEETLHRSNLLSARALIACTNIDAVNLSIGLSGKHIRRDLRTVLRIFDTQFARAIQEVLGFEAALSASLLSAPVFVATALYGDAIHAFVLRNSLVTLMPPGCEMDPKSAYHSLDIRYKSKVVPVVVALRSIS
ncbi:MAG: NAD-binding protein [Armatimonadetes bacterium]|nr:NAD-binding protein [Armatimonadota bacterium]